MTRSALRATLDWSYELLTEPERLVLHHLSLFAGGLTLEAASQAAGSAGISESDVIDCVGNLVDKSLVTADVGIEVRYRLLETTRAYAFGKLIESGQYGDVARRHAEYYRTLFSEPLQKPRRHSRSEATVSATPIVTSPPGAKAQSSAARTLSLEMQLNATLAATLFNTKGPGLEASAAWRDVLETAEQLDDTEYRLRALWGLWYNHISNGECRAALTLAQSYYTVPRDQAGPADVLIGERMLGTSQYYLGDLSNARHHLEHMLSHCTNPLRRSHMIRFQIDLPVAARGTLARVLWLQGFPDQAMRMVNDNLEDARAIDRVASVSLYWALDAACVIALTVGDLATAE